MQLEGKHRNLYCIGLYLFFVLFYYFILFYCFILFYFLFPCNPFTVSLIGKSLEALLHIINDGSYKDLNCYTEEKVGSEDS